MSNPCRPRVAIIDSGGANINSIVFAFERLGCRPSFTDDWQVIQAASHVVLPGVGSAAAAMEKLTASGLAEKIPTLTQPVVGICLGMQLLFDSSQEGGVECLGVIPGEVKKLAAGDGLTVPHIGWNRNRLVELEARDLEARENCRGLFDGVDDGFYAYFVHSFAAPVGPWTVAECRHGQSFSSIVAHRNFIGIQFHPERSSVDGRRLLGQFLNIGTSQGMGTAV